MSRRAPGWFAGAGADLKINPKPDDNHFIRQREIVAPGPASAGTSKRRARSNTLPPVLFTLADHVRGAVDEMSEAGVGLAVSWGV